MDFSGRVAIVTGAGSQHGIGHATAVAFAKQGANIVVADVDIEGCQKTASEARALGARALAVRVDISDESSVQALVDTALDTFGRIDILVNNAGIGRAIRTADMTAEDFIDVIRVNLLGTFLCSKAVLKPMAQQRYGRIVSVSSVSGKRGGSTYGGSHYCASKAGILGFSKTLAREVVNDGITVNCVCPGHITTGFHVGLDDEGLAAICSIIPMHRAGKPEEIAPAILFLASEEASYITGEDIDVNGGLHMD
jgi:3-oxoacyl-[acyl-carrier protein] reductase